MPPKNDKEARRQELARLGQALYGPEWVAPTARALGANIRTVQRWAAGERDDAPSQGALADMRAHVAAHAGSRIAELRRWIDTLEYARRGAEMGQPGGSTTICGIEAAMLPHWPRYEGPRIVVGSATLLAWRYSTPDGGWTPRRVCNYVFVEPRERPLVRNGEPSTHETTGEMRPLVIAVPTPERWDADAINNLGQPGASVLAPDWPAIREAVATLRAAHGPLPVIIEEIPQRWPAAEPI